MANGNAITLDDDGLTKFIHETVRQVLAANEKLECEDGVTVVPRFKIAFSGVVIAKGGRNLLPRTVATTKGPLTNESIEEAAVEKTSQEGNQESKATEHAVVVAKETQKSHSSESGSNTSEGNQREKSNSTTKADESSESSSKSTNTSDTTSKDAQKSQQSQAQGTRQETNIEYSR